MPSLLFRTLVLCAILATRALAADEPEPKSRMKEVLRARTAEEAKKKAAPAAAAPAAPAKAENPAAKPAGENPPAAAVLFPEPAKAAAGAEAAATVLPMVVVKKDRVTVLDRQLQEQEKAIAREKKNTKPTELDKALNDSKVSKALSIFGGQSGDYRANISKERIQLMEEEKELMEAIAQAKSPSEKAALQKELDQLKALRRDLEKTLR